MPLSTSLYPALSINLSNIEIIFWGMPRIEPGASELCSPQLKGRSLYSRHLFEPRRVLHPDKNQPLMVEWIPPTQLLQERKKVLSGRLVPIYIFSHFSPRGDFVQFFFSEWFISSFVWRNSDKSFWSSGILSSLYRNIDLLFNALNQRVLLGWKFKELTTTR